MGKDKKLITNFNNSDDDGNPYLVFRKKMLKKLNDNHPEIDKKQQLEIILKKWEKMSSEQRNK